MIYYTFYRSSSNINRQPKWARQKNRANVARATKGTVPSCRKIVKIYIFYRFSESETEVESQELIDKANGKKGKAGK